MLIEVTREDIKRGIPQRPSECPVALALRRETGMKWSVDSEDLVSGKISRETPKKAGRFILRFDAGKKVRPFSFKLKVL